MRIATDIERQYNSHQESVLFRIYIYSQDPDVKISWTARSQDLTCNSATCKIDRGRHGILLLFRIQIVLLSRNRYSAVRRRTRIIYDLPPTFSIFITLYYIDINSRYLPPYQLRFPFPLYLLNLQLKARQPIKSLLRPRPHRNTQAPVAKSTRKSQRKALISVIPE